MNSDYSPTDFSIAAEWQVWGGGSDTHNAWGRRRTRATMVSLCRSVCVCVCLLGRARPCYGHDATPAAPGPLPVWLSRAGSDVIRLFSSPPGRGNGLERDMESLSVCLSDCQCLLRLGPVTNSRNLLVSLLNLLELARIHNVTFIQQTLAFIFI